MQKEFPVPNILPFTDPCHHIPLFSLEKWLFTWSILLLCSALLSDSFSFNCLPLSSSSSSFSDSLTPTLLLFHTCSCISYITPQNFCVKFQDPPTHWLIHMKEQWTWDANNMTQPRTRTHRLTHAHSQRQALRTCLKRKAKSTLAFTLRISHSRIHGHKHKA